jgi:hypothetical protein
VPSWWGNTRCWVRLRWVGLLGLVPVRGGFRDVMWAGWPQGEPAVLRLGIERREGHLVDALALRGDEGRSTLRKARGRCERLVIPGSPNGATHRGLVSRYPHLNS